MFNILEDAVEVYLANPQEVKNRKGHKTDDKDGWWIQLRLEEDITAQIQRAGLEPQFELVRSVPAIGEMGAAIILAETGGQMKTFRAKRT